jgi:hypothetical protein
MVNYFRHKIEQRENKVHDGAAASGEEWALLPGMTAFMMVINVY